MAKRVVLDPSAALVEFLVGEFYQVERVGNLPGRRKGVIEGLAIWAGQVEHSPTDLLAPGLGAGGDPLGGPGRGSSGDHVEQLGWPAWADIDDRGHELLAVSFPAPHEQRLVQAQRLHDLCDAVRVVDQSGPERDHGVVNGVPVTAQLSGHLSHSAPELADLPGGPPSGPVGHDLAGRRDARVFPGPRPHLAITVGAAQPELVPTKPDWPPETRQIREKHLVSVLHPDGPPQL